MILDILTWNSSKDVDDDDDDDDDDHAYSRVLESG